MNKIKIDKNKKNMIIFLTLSAKNMRVISCQASVFHGFEKHYNIIYVSTGRGVLTTKYFDVDSKVPNLDTNTVYIGEDIGNIYDNSGKHTNEYHSKNNNLMRALDENEFVPDVIVNWGPGNNDKGSMKNVLSLYENTKSQTFNTSIMKMLPLHIILTLMKKYPKVHYAEHSIDPLFLSFTPDLPNPMTYTHEHNFDYYKRFDAYQIYLLNNVKRGDYNEKDISFVFGLSAFKNQSRFDLVDRLKIILKDEKHFYIKMNDPKKKIKMNTLLPRPEYNALITRAKFTFIAPAYIHYAFSITRLCDTIYGGCCPIFDSRCNFKILEDDFGVDIDILKPVIHDVQDDVLIYPNDNQRAEIVEHLYDRLFNHLHLDFLQDGKIKNNDYMNIQKPEEDEYSSLDDF